jgi:hypothetical protein
MALAGARKADPKVPGVWSNLAAPDTLVRTDSASLTFFRQRIAKLLSSPSDTASLTLLADRAARRHGPALLCSGSSGGNTHVGVLGAILKGAGIGRKTHSATPGNGPRSPFA